MITMLHYDMLKTPSLDADGIRRVEKLMTKPNPSLHQAYLEKTPYEEIGETGMNEVCLGVNSSGFTITRGVCSNGVVPYAFALMPSSRFK